LRAFALNKRLAKYGSKPAYPKCTPEPADTTEKFSERIAAELDQQIAALQKRKDALINEVSESRRSLDESWDQRKLSLVPGDELLDAVCKRFGVRFTKEQDSVRIAGLMTAEEIDDEIENLINDFGGPEK
jgi:hypothetical protein